MMLPINNGDKPKIKLDMLGVVVTFWEFQILRIGSLLMVKYWYAPIIATGKPKERVLTIFLEKSSLVITKFVIITKPNTTAANGDILTKIKPITK